MVQYHSDYGTGQVIEGRRIFWNVNGESVLDWGYFWEHYERTQPTLLIMMNNIGAALEAKRRRPTTLVIHREYFRSDTQFWRETPPQAAANRIKDLTPKNSGIIHLQSNEPSTDDPGREGFDMEYSDECAKWYLDTQEYLGPGYQQATGWAFSKSFDLAKFQRGDMDFFIHGLDQLRGELWLAGTSYTFGSIPGYFMARYPDVLFEPQTMQKANWPYNIDMGGKGRYAHFWHHLRHHWLNIRRLDLDIEMPIPTLLIEMAHDQIEANRAFRGSTLGKEFANQFNGGNHVDGIHTLRGYHNITYPGVGFEDSFADEFEYFEKILPPEVIGGGIFTLSQVGQWARFDGSRMYRFHERLEQFPIHRYDPAYEDDMTDAPDTKPIYPGIPTDDSPDWGQPETIEPGGKENNTFFNTRNLPSTTNGDIVRKVDGEVLVSLHKTVTWPDDRKRGTWRVLRFPNGQKLWAADWVFLSVAGDEPEIPEEPEPEPEPEPTPDPEPPTDDKALYPAVIWTYIWTMTEDRRKEYAYLDIAKGLAMLEIDFWHLNAEQLHKVIEELVAEAKKRATSEMTAINLSEKKPADKPDDSQEAA